MKFKGTWALLGVAILFGAYIYFVEIKKTARDEQAKEAAEKILTVDTAKVNAIDVKNSHGSFSLQKADGKTWKLISPVQDAADDNQVSSMLKALSTDKYDQEIDGEDLKTYGLDHPGITATFKTSDGKSDTLDVGIDSPLPGKVYIRRNGGKKVLFANSLVKTNLDRELKDFRDKRIFKGDKDDIKSVVLKYNTKQNHSVIDLEKKDKEWDINGPHSADSDAVTGLLNTIDSLRATDFPSEKGENKLEQRKYGVDKPDLVMTLAGKDKKVLAEISVSPKKDNNIYLEVAGTPAIYQSYPGAAEQLMHTPADFRDKKGPFQFKKDDVKDITVKTGSLDLHLIKKANSWELPFPDPKKQPDQIQIENFLDRINDLRVSEFVDKEKPRGLDHPQGTLWFKDGLGHDVLKLVWGAKTKSGKSYFVKTNKSDGAVGVDVSSLDTLPTKNLVQDVKPTPTPVPGKIGVSERKTKPAGPT